MSEFLPRKFRNLAAGLFIASSVVTAGAAISFRQTSPDIDKILAEHSRLIFSPSGQKAAYTERLADENGDMVSKLFVVDSYLGVINFDSIRQIAGSYGELSNPSWSPDGETLSYMSRATLRLNGGNQTNSLIESAIRIIDTSGTYTPTSYSGLKETEFGNPKWIDANNIVVPVTDGIRRFSVAKFGNDLSVSLNP